MDGSLSTPGPAQIGAQALRYPNPVALYDRMPALAALTRMRPDPSEGPLPYLERLRGGPIPEEALTLACFALVPPLAVRWVFECFRLAGDPIDPTDRQLLEHVAHWADSPTEAHRRRTEAAAEGADAYKATTLLAHAVARSSADRGPEDLCRALNGAVLTSAALATLPRRRNRILGYTSLAREFLAA